MESATELFSNGFNCAQSVFIPFAKQKGLDQITAAQVASAFGAGMGRSQNVCGAVTGALLALGLHHGYSVPTNSKAKEETYQLALDLQAKFIAEHGTISCRELLGIDLQTPEGRDAFQSKQLHKNVCTNCVASATQIVQELLEQNHKE
jgi:C_GCAxxG_C_C family probable redox protein